ncbi:unnamed protein product, partial [Prorocentrum cordatum]
WSRLRGGDGKPSGRPDTTSNGVTVPSEGRHSSCASSGPPGPLQGAALNPGSAVHGTGDCSPCAWFWKKKGCSNGQQCEFCHICPEGELKNRKKQRQQDKKAGETKPSGRYVSKSDGSMPDRRGKRGNQDERAGSSASSTSWAQGKGGSEPAFHYSHASSSHLFHNPGFVPPRAPPGLEAMPTWPGYRVPRSPGGYARQPSSGTSSPWKDTSHAKVLRLDNML